jgi:hypothetical protein
MIVKSGKMERALGGIWYNNLKAAAARLRAFRALMRFRTWALRTLNHAKTQEVRFCCGRCAAPLSRPLRGAFVEAASRRLCRGRFAAPWYNNLKAAACAAVRTLCADALPHMGFETLNHAKPRRRGFVGAAARRHGIMTLILPPARCPG